MPSNLVRKRARPLSWGAAGLAIARRAYNGYRSYRQVKGVVGRRVQGKLRDAQPLTTQHDFSTQYRKRRRRRGRKVRRAKRFRRAVRNYENSMLGCRLHLRNGSGSVTWGINSATTWTLSLGLIRQGGARETTVRNVVDSLLSGNASLKNTTRMLLQSGVMDISLTARSTNTTPVDLDVYMIVARKPLPNGVLGSNLEAFMQNEMNMPNTNSGYIPVTDLGVAVARTATSVTVNTIGYTPFISPNFCSYFTVLSKKKILLTPGGTTHLQLKKQWNRTLSLEDTSRYDSMKGITVGYVFNANSVYIGGANQPAGNIDFNWEMYYNVKQLRDSEDTVVAV